MKCTSPNCAYNSVGDHSHCANCIRQAHLRDFYTAPTNKALAYIKKTLAEQYEDFP